MNNRVSFEEQQIDIEIGKRLREIRQFRGFKIQDIANWIGVSHQQAQKYEKGANRLSIAKLLVLCCYLRVDINYFIKDLAPPIRRDYIDHSTVSISMQ